MVARLRALGLPGRHGAHVPRARALDAPPLLAEPARRAADPRAARLEAADHRPARAPAARALPVHPGEGPRGRDRVGEVAPGHAARVRGRRGRRRPRAARPRRPVRPDVRGLRAGEGAGRADGLRRPPGGHRRPAGGRCARPRRRSAPASAGSASTSTRTRARSSSGCSSCGSASHGTCASWATRTRRSTRSPARRRRSSPRSPDAGRARPRSALVRNYRSTPQVLALANRLLAAEGRSKRLEATRGDGPEPTITRHATAEAELAALVGGDPRAARRAGSPRRRSRSSCARTPSSRRSRRRSPGRASRTSSAASGSTTAPRCAAR